MLVLEENALEGFIEEEIAEPKGDEAKEKYKKNMVKAKRIIADSIKDHLIPHVSSLKTLQSRCFMLCLGYMKTTTSIERWR